MKKSFLLTMIIIVVVAAFAGTAFYSNNQPPDIQPADDSAATLKGINTVIRANNRFALDIYSEINKDKGNIFFSPYSIVTALAMTYEGARGKTAEEIESVLHLPADEKLRRPAFAAIYNQLNKQDSKYELSTANALWVQKDYKLLDSYITAVKQYYSGNATNLDFEHSTEKSRETINDWVSNKTNNKINDLLPSLDTLTRLVLTNAVYFKGDWLKPFEKSRTIDEAFHLSAKSAIKVPMMEQTGDESRFNYEETKDLQILEMPYEGDKLSMLIFLPKKNDLAALESKLTLDQIEGWKSKLTKKQVNVYIPKFKLEAKYQLAGTLVKMGMPALFSPGADLSGVDGARDLFVSDVIHQSFIDVFEEGTEAAAATAVGLVGGLPKEIMPTFRADHPFLFLIQDKTNGNILFLGRVQNPTK